MSEARGLVGVAAKRIVTADPARITPDNLLGVVEDGVVVYDDEGGVIDLAEKAGIVDLRYPAPPTNDAVVGLYCYPADVFSVIASLERSSRGELEITDVNRAYAQRGALSVVPVRGWWEDAGKHWQHLAEIGRTIDETGVNK